MSFIRPEARAVMYRWREALVGAGIVAIGFSWALGPGGLLGLLGWALVLAGGVLFLTGVQRGRFRASGDGPGSVDVDEGQVTYFGPLTGGAIALREMTALALIQMEQTPHWRLSVGTDHVHIPVDAAGADQLFDAFTTLPGLSMQRLIRAMEEKPARDIVIWSRVPLREVTDRLH